MRVLITGGCGFTGGYLAASFASDHVAVAVVDRRGSADVPVANGISVIDASVYDRAAMERVFESFRPTLVYHLAAIHYIPDCEAHPREVQRTNVEGTGVVAALAERFGAKLVFTSSAAVYRPSDRPHRESDPVEPIDVYGRSKLAAEQLLTSVAGSRLDVVIARLFNVYGTGERTPHLIPRVVRQVADGAQQLVLGALDPARDFVNVNDAVRALRHVADLPSGSAVNVATGRATSVRDVVAICGDIVGRSLTIAQTPELLRPVDRPCLCGDASALHDATGWQPAISLTDGLESMIEAAAGARLITTG